MKGQPTVDQPLPESLLTLTVSAINEQILGPVCLITEQKDQLRTHPRCIACGNALVLLADMLGADVRLCTNCHPCPPPQALASPATWRAGNMRP